MTLSPGGMLSHYRLVETIGRGGMGVVWRARDTRLRRHVALKVLPPDVIADRERRLRFMREARAAAAINHPNIATIHEIDEDQGIIFIAMELVEGKSLRSLIKGGPLPIGDALGIAAGVAGGLAEAHRARVVHRDLKPENIIVTPGGQPKILDFGLAKVFEEEAQASRSGLSQEETATEEMTRQGRILGTFVYMSPEQARGEPVDPRSDIFAFGITLYEMVTGKRPFTGRTAIDTLASIIHKPAVPAPELNADVGPGLNELLETCLKKAPDERYSDARELETHVRRLLRECDAGLTPAAAVRRGPRRTNWRGAVVPGALGLLVAGVVALGVWKVPDMLGTGVNPKTILVLPMKVRGQTEGGEYVGTAFSETLSITLAEAEDLTVLAIADTDTPSGGTAGQTRAARDRGAGRLLTGALTREDQNVHASLRLLDTSSGRVLWGASRDSAGADLSQLATSLARDVADELGASIGRLYGALLKTVNSEMAGSSLLIDSLGALRRHEGETALNTTAKLIEAFPGEPVAHILRARASIIATNPQVDPAEVLEESRKLIEESWLTADRLDPGNPYTEKERAWFAFLRGESGDARQRYTSLLARDDLTPAYRVTLLEATAYVENGSGEIAAALEHMEEARRLDPTNTSVLVWLSRTLLRTGKSEEALVRARQAWSLNHRSSEANWALGSALKFLNRPDEGVPFLARACELAKSPDVCAIYANILHRAGDEEGALRVATEAASMPESRYGASNLACYQALAGRREEALRLLRRALEMNFDDAGDLRNDCYSGLRGDPGFEAIEASVRKRAGSTPLREGATPIPESLLP